MLPTIKKGRPKKAEAPKEWSVGKIQDVEGYGPVQCVADAEEGHLPLPTPCSLCVFRKKRECLTSSGNCMDDNYHFEYPKE